MLVPRRVYQFLDIFQVCQGTAQAGDRRSWRKGARSIQAIQAIIGSGCCRVVDAGREDGTSTSDIFWLVVEPAQPI